MLLYSLAPYVHNQHSVLVQLCDAWNATTFDPLEIGSPCENKIDLRASYSASVRHQMFFSLPEQCISHDQTLCLRKLQYCLAFLVWFSISNASVSVDDFLLPTVIFKTSIYEHSFVSWSCLDVPRKQLPELIRLTVLLAVLMHCKPCPIHPARKTWACP